MLNQKLQTGEVESDHQVQVIKQKAFQNPNHVLGILPEFDPSNQMAGLNAAQFVSRIDSLKKIYQWDDKLIMFLSSSKLKGAAKLWLDSQTLNSCNCGNNFHLN